MDQHFPEQLRQAYERARQHYASVVFIGSPMLEEQVQWSASLARFSQQDETAGSLTFAEPPDYLAAWPVAESAAFAPDSQLRFYLDGAQHTRLLFIVDTVPVCATVGAASILTRPQPGDRLERWLSSPPGFAILLPDAPSVRPLWDAFQAAGLPVTDTLNPQFLMHQRKTPDQIAASFELCRFLVYQQALQIRRDLERDLLRAWVESGTKGWLVIDGYIRYLRADIASAPVIGLVKQQRHEYFTGAARALLLGLPAFHRTNLFRVRQTAEPNTGADTSFFLRWRPPPTLAEPDYGLLRVESPLNLDTDLANTLGRWIVAEGRPVQMGRDGNHLYCIASAERSAKQIVTSAWRQLPQRWLK